MGNRAPMKANRAPMKGNRAPVKDNRAARRSAPIYAYAPEDDEQLRA